MQNSKAPSLDDLPAPPSGWPQPAAGITLCMIVRDEERFLGDALESVKGVVDEICIVDTGSRDRTIAIGRAAGARIEEIPWQDDFSQARNAALEMATRRWIMVLDADEMLLPKSREALLELRTRPAHLTGLWIRCHNQSDDYKGTGSMSNAIVRVFPSHRRLRYRNRIHEFVALDGSPAGMPAIASSVEIVHRGYLKDVMRERGKGERNLAMAEAALRSEPDEPYSWFNYASSALLAEKPEVAISALERMRELNAGRKQGFIPAGLGLLADLYLANTQDAVKSEEIAREILGYTPTFANAHFSLGKALAAQRRYAEAREAFVAAIEDGKHTQDHFAVDNEVPLWKAHSEIGGTLMEEGAYELALAWFEFALQQRPRVQPVRLNRARALERLERREEAEAAFREVWEEDRDDPAAIDYLNFLLRAGRDAEAVALIDDAAEHVTAETRLILYGSAAAIASRLGDRPKGEGYVARALAIDGVPDRPERLAGLFRHYGDAALLQLLAGPGHAPFTLAPRKPGLVDTKE